MECVVCGKAVSKKARTCSAKCRQAYRRSVTGSVTNVTVDKCDKQSVTGSEYFTDACGTKHKTDYEGRRRDRELLASWAHGDGTPYQERLGILAAQYDVLKGGASYTGYAQSP